MRPTRPIVLGNWKMHGLRAPGVALARAVAAGAGPAATLGVFPPATILHAVAEALAGSTVLVGGQDCHHASQGAYTGSVSAAMLADAGATWTLLGHSERRHGLGEDDPLIAAKARAAIAAGLGVVICVGETEAEYVAGATLERLAAQVEGSIPADLPADRLIVAYEPVWAIGTGRTPADAEIARAHAHLRALLGRRLAGGEQVPLLYGGSVKSGNAGAILATANVDGALVGGASLDAGEFLAIAAAGARV